MPKGRLFAPNKQRDGIWYQHRGVEQEWPPMRQADTSTGYMLKTPFEKLPITYPPLPPPPYNKKDGSVDVLDPVYPQPGTGPRRFGLFRYMQRKRNFSQSNDFSVHDNRYLHQSHGVHFGNEKQPYKKLSGKDTRILGRRLAPKHPQLHSTDNDYLVHEGCEQFETHMTSHVDNYRGTQSEDPVVHRRYPRQHVLSESMRDARQEPGGTATMTTRNEEWFRNTGEGFKLKTQALINTQEPHLKPNKWKYSNHGLPRLYPPYNTKTRPLPQWLISGEPDSACSVAN